MVLTKAVLKYIFVKLQDLEKETEFSFLLGLPTVKVYFVKDLHPPGFLVHRLYTKLYFLKV